LNTLICFILVVKQYFNRPFSLAAEDISDLWNSGHQCIHARPEADIMLDYLKQFLYKFMLGYFFKNQSGKIRNMNGKRSSSFPTYVCRTAPNLTPWSLRKNKTVLFKVVSLLISSKIFKYIASFKCLIILRQDSPNFLRTILIDPFHLQPKTYLISGTLDISVFMCSLIQSGISTNILENF
jgi:hypothetical protein